MTSALVILNYPLQNQINVGHIDLLKIQFENMLNIFDEVHVISPRDNHHYDLRWDSRIIIHTTGCSNKYLYYFSPISDLLYTLKLINQKDVKVIRALAISSGFLAVLAGKIAKIPSVVSIHADRRLLEKREGESKLKHTLLKLVERWTYREATVLPIISEYIGRYIISISHRTNNLFLHYNFVDTDLFKPIFHKNKIPSLIFVSRLSKFYKINILLDAIKIVLTQKNVNAIICGDGPEREYFEAHSQRIRTNKHVKFLGRVSHDTELPILLANSDVFISMGGGVTIAEAMSCGIPVVGTDFEWTSEIVNNETGKLVRHDSAQDLASGLITLLNDLHHLKQISPVSRTVAVNNFSKKSWLTREINLYQKLTGIKK